MGARVSGVAKVRTIRGLVFAAVLLAMPVAAQAQSQLSQTRTISSISNGYCFFDLDNNGVFDSNDYPAADPAIDNNDILGKDLITYTAIDGDNLTTTTPVVQGVLHRPDVLGALEAGRNYDINITNICLGEASRTDTIVTVTDDDDTDDADGDGNPANDQDTTTTTTQTGTSSDLAIYDDDGFTFGGNSVIGFTGQIIGDIEFDASITDSGGTAYNDDVTFTLGEGSEIVGSLDFGTAGSANVAVSDAVISLNGAVAGVGLAGASNIELTNNAEIVGALTAGNISEGLDLINTAAVGSLDLSGSDTVNASLTSTSAVGTLTASNLGDAASVITNAGAVNIIRALNNPLLSVTNSGTVAAPVDGAVILGGVDIVFNNTGTLSAASGGTVDLSAVTGTVQFNSSGTVTASTTDIVLAGGATGNVNIVNTGTMSTTNSRGLTLTDIAGAVSVINGTGSVPGSAVPSGAGSLTAFDTAINVSDSEALDDAASQAMQVTIRQDSAASRIEVTAEHAVLADNVASLTLVSQGVIDAGTDNAIQADNAGSVTIENNGASARISAGDQTAIRATGLAGAFSLTNAGTVESRNATLVLDDAAGAIGLVNSGTLRATHPADSAGFDHDDDPLTAVLDDFVVQASRAAGATGGAVTVSNESDGVISINSSNALRLSDFSAADDSVTLTNAGSLTAGALYALRLDDIRAFSLTNSGTMTATNEVVTATDLVGTVTLNNSGTLRATHTVDAADAATNFAVNLARNASDNGGALALTNSGTISIASDNAVSLSGFNRDDDAVTLTNSGQISAGREAAIVMTSAKGVTISNSGETARIEATGDRAIDIAAIDGAFSLTNGGTISALNETLDVGDISGGVTVTNSGTLRATHSLDNADATTNFALRLARLNSAAGGVVGITNSGTISVNSDNAVFLSGFDETADAVSVTGAGTISAGRDNALRLDVVNGFTLNNSGTVSAVRDNALSIGTGGALALTNSGTISAGRNNALAVTTANSFSLNNSGETAAITATTDDALSVGTVTGAFALTNAGTVSAANRAVTLGSASGAVSITNSGTIRVTADDAAHAINITTAGAGVSITNSDTIASSADRAIHIQTVTGDMSVGNTGSLTATGEYALRGGSVSGNVSITNSGTLTAATNAVQTQSPGGNFTLVNSGTLTTSDAASDYLVSAGSVTGNVSVTNSGTISVAGGRVMDLRNAGGAVTIDNSGTVSSLGGRVFDIRNAGGAVRVTNSSTLTATTAPVIDANAAAAGFTLDNSGALSGTAMLVDARIAGGAISVTNGGNVTSTGAYALRADAAPASVAVNNTGTIAGQANALYLSGATGAVGIINSGILRATAATALDASNGAAVTLTNSGTIAAASDAVLLSDAAAALVTNAANAGISASAGDALVAANVDGMVVTNNGTISATGGTAISITGEAGEIVNTGTIASNMIALSVGSDAEIVNLGTINAGTEAVAVQFSGTGSVLQLSEDAKLIGRLVAPAIAEEDDRHEIVINLDAGLSYHYAFESGGIKFTDNQGGDRPQATGSAHGASSAMVRAQDLLLARRAVSLVRGYHESSPLFDNRQLNAVYWRGDSVQEPSATENYHLRDKNGGWMGTTLLGLLPKRRLQFLVAQDRIEAAVNLDMQNFKSDYVGFGLAARTLANYQGIYLSAFGLLGVSDNETERRIVTNTHAAGQLNTGASYYSAHLDTHMSLNYALRLTRGLQMDVRVGLGVSAVQQESHDEGDYYRHDGHLLMQGLIDSNLRLAYDWNEGYLPQREVAFLDFSAGYRGVLSGDEREFRFLDAGVTEGADARFIDDERGETLFRVGVGYERTMARGLMLSISAARSGHASGFESDDVSAGLRWRF